MEDLFVRMLNIDRKERITFPEIMLHPAFASFLGNSSSTMSLVTPTNRYSEFEREKQVVSLMMEEIEFPAKVADRVYKVAESIG